MNIIIVGGGKTGSYLASLLSGRGDTVRVIESRKTVVQRLEAKLPEGTVVRGMGLEPRCPRGGRCTAFGRCDCRYG